ncbi:hypothetical protein GCM10009753_69670 [Streptantibioticus ferralitis]
MAVRRAGVGAARTAVGEPRAARTLRRAGAGAGGTCSGMVGRLSLETGVVQDAVRRTLGRCWCTARCYGTLSTGHPAPVRGGMSGSDGGMQSPSLGLGVRWGATGGLRSLCLCAKFIRNVFARRFGYRVAVVGTRLY